MVVTAVPTTAFICALVLALRYMAIPAIAMPVAVSNYVITPMPSLTAICAIATTMVWVLMKAHMESAVILGKIMLFTLTHLILSMLRL